MRTLECYLAAVLGWTRTNRLKSNPDKMEILLLRGHLDQLGGLLPYLDGSYPPSRMRLAIWMCFWTQTFWTQLNGESDLNQSQFFLFPT